MRNPKRLSEIKEKLIAASKSYYNDGASPLTDQQFDDLKDEMKKLAPNDPFFSQIGARVDEVTEWKKAKHKISMCSLNKCNTIDELSKWTKECDIKELIIEDKLDGCSINLEYDNGKLINGITRGDGIFGENIINNILKMQNVKSSLKDFTGCLRGEVYFELDDFEKVNEHCRKMQWKELSNPRNGATGTSKRFDGEFSQYLTIRYYDLEGIDFDTEFEKMEFIKNSFCLKTSFYKKVSVDEAIKLYEQYEKSLRAETNYDIDGVVCKVNNIEKQKELGLLGSNPKGQIAWKFKPMIGETELLDVEWGLGNSQRLTPVGILKPLKLGGVIITHVNLHNLENFKKLKLYKNCKVIIKRANDVIPYLLGIKNA